MIHLSGGDPCPAGQVELWRSGTLCDATIQVGGTAFGVHRSVLAGASEYMRALFTSGMRDSTSAAVTVSEVAAPVMRSILTFLYEMQLEVSASTLSEVMRVASRLEVSALLTVKEPLKHRAHEQLRAWT